MSITASVTGRPITASVSGSTVNASVGSSTISASAGGGIGPVGPQGQTGATGPAGPPSNVVDMEDVLVENVTDGDLLRYSGGKFRNYNETLITDGGNF